MKKYDTWSSKSLKKFKMLNLMILMIILEYHIKGL